MPRTSSDDKIQKRKNKERAPKDKKKKRSRWHGDEDDRRFSRFEAVASEVSALALAAAAAPCRPSLPRLVELTACQGRDEESDVDDEEREVEAYDRKSADAECGAFDLPCWRSASCGMRVTLREQVFASVEEP
jgi:hypothetical protein